jgi:phosphoenolpyruvate-protein kinase (PTS system EI component)
VNGIIRYDASPLKEKLKSIDTFLITVNDCYRLCVEIKNASIADKKVKLPPNLLDSVQKIISEAHTILSFKGTYS